MKILMVTSEMDGIVKTGGLADFAEALPKALISRGHDVRVVLPKYRNAFFPEPVKSEPLYFNLNHSDRYGCLVHHAHISFSRPESGSEENISPTGNIIPVRLVEHHDFFGRSGIYGDYNDISAYPDNALRYAFLCKAAIEMCLNERWIPDIIHCNDWQTALLPYYMKEHYSYTPEYKENGFSLRNTGTLLTIHNGEYQGKSDAGWIDSLGIRPELFTSRLMEEYGLLNLLKCGIMYADAINAVSPGYCRELLDSGTSHQNLWLYLDARKERFSGILNGCDYTLWNPGTDRLIPHHFSDQDLSGKALCKAALQAKMRLPVDSNIPLFGLVSRLTAQKGFDYLIPSLERLLYEDAPLQIAMLGSGEPDYGSRLHHLERRYSHRMSFVNGYDNGLSHLVEAGSDFFMMPSLFEPCGLNQLYSLAYGTIPVVRQTGGLKDTVTGLEKNSENAGIATGISFGWPDSENCYEAIKQGIYLYLHDRALYLAIQKQAMSQRFTWDQSAQQYEILYRNIKLSLQK